MFVRPIIYDSRLKLLNAFNHSRKHMCFESYEVHLLKSAEADLGLLQHSRWSALW